LAQVVVARHKELEPDQVVEVVLQKELLRLRPVLFFQLLSVKVAVVLRQQL
jgi:hypothetical protein